MNRRRFLGLAAGATLGGSLVASAGMSSKQEPAKATSPSTPSGRVPIDPERVSLRNRNRSTVACRNGIVCASEPLAAMAGIDILKAGGNCVDAAIATNAVLGVTEPAMNGIGGDLFAILWHEEDRRLYGLNASGRAARAFDLARASELRLESIPRRSTLSWSVPGCVDGWSMLSERFGALSLATCLEPAIAHASEGFPLSPIIAGHFAFDGAENPTLAAVYQPDGAVPRFGDLFRNPMLACSLRQIADHGRQAFYEGDIAQRIAERAAAGEGFLTREDLAAHRGTWVDPVSTNYRGYDVWELPPNGQGIAALQMLNLLEHFDLAELGPDSAQYLHLLVEAKKLAFEDRARYYADPDFADVPVAELISKNYAAQRVELIDRSKSSDRPPPGDPELDSDTIYLSAADSKGNMISFIQSIYSGFGSTICPEGVGFPMQNRGQAFSLDPGHRNRLEPGKRPFHTIIPAFVTLDGKPLLSFGVMGGDFQPQGHTQVLVNMLDFGMSPQQAGEQPRLAHDGSSTPWGGKADGGGSLVFEHGFEESTREQLRSMGHRVSESLSAHGGYQAVWRQDDPRIYFGGSDPRKDGAALGY